jgi:hypothetical protein
MRRKIRRWVTIVLRIFSFFTLAFSAFCTFLGAAPSSAIRAVLGPDIVRHLLYVREGVLNMTAEQARWFLVVQGDLLFATALYFLFYVHFRNKLSKIYVTQQEFGEKMARFNGLLGDKQTGFNSKIAAIERDVDEQSAITKQKLAAAIKRERSARKLHDRAYKMLRQIREAKTGQPPTAKPATSP